MRWLLALAAASSAAPAQAAWIKAETSHFVIYADKSPEALRDFATKLEHFDSAVRIARAMPDEPPGPNNRLTVFVLRDVDAVQGLMHARGSGIAGLYSPRFSGSVSFVPDDTSDIRASSFTPQTVFFHEYSHHLMMQSLDEVLPKWLVEGFAEFYSTARFEKDGSVGFGIAPAHRAYALDLRTLPLQDMLSGNFASNAENSEQIYGRGWLLTHYLAFNKERAGQLTAYVRGISSGLEPLEAARRAFGDLEILAKEVDRYRNRKRLDYVLVAADKLKVPQVTVTPLSAGEAAIMKLRLRTSYGVDKKTAPGIAADAAEVARDFPNDAAVWTELAEAELDADHPAAASTAAEKAIALDPKSVNAYLFAGLAEEKLAEKDRSRANWSAIRARYLRANKIDPDDPEPLVRYYRSFGAEGIAPTRNAIDGLYLAADLVPQDHNLRLLVARQLLLDNKLDAARRELAPVGYNPHAGKTAEAAAKIVELIKAGDKEGATRALEALMGAREG
jgi:tetratricopeptide (TPR) repeat protein